MMIIRIHFKIQLKREMRKLYIKKNFECLSKEIYKFLRGLSPFITFETSSHFSILDKQTVWFRNEKITYQTGSGNLFWKWVPHKKGSIKFIIDPVIGSINRYPYYRSEASSNSFLTFFTYVLWVYYEYMLRL